MRMSAVSSPFFRSFQMRLLALRGIEHCILHEKKIAQEERKTRDYIPTALSSNNFPQLIVVLGLMNCGVNFIKVFPLCIDLLTDLTARRALISPVEDLCRTICQLPSLQFFECWSPFLGPPLKKVPLNISTATASTGSYPSAAVDGKPSTYWLCTRSRATWSIELAPDSTTSSSSSSAGSVCGVNVVAIKISWRPQQPSTVTHNSAPKKFYIYVKKSRDSSDFSRVLTVDPELEYGKQNSWTQTYYVNAPDVSAVQIIISKHAASNPTSTVKMYNFEVLTEDLGSDSVRTLQMLKTVQTSLMPLLAYSYLEKRVYDTLLSLIRVSGSLSVAISFVHFIRMKNLDSRLKSTAAEALQLLFDSMAEQ